MNEAKCALMQPNGIKAALKMWNPRGCCCFSSVAEQRVVPATEHLRCSAAQMSVREGFIDPGTSPPGSSLLTSTPNNQ